MLKAITVYNGNLAEATSITLIIIYSDGFSSNYHGRPYTNNNVSSLNELWNKMIFSNKDHFWMKVYTNKLVQLAPMLHVDMVAVV